MIVAAITDGDGGGTGAAVCAAFCKSGAAVFALCDAGGAAATNAAVGTCGGGGGSDASDSGDDCGSAALGTDCVVLLLLPFCLSERAARLRSSVSLLRGAAVAVAVPAPDTAADGGGGGGSGVAVALCTYVCDAEGIGMLPPLPLLYPPAPPGVMPSMLRSAFESLNAGAAAGGADCSTDGLTLLLLPVALLLLPPPPPPLLMPPPPLLLLLPSPPTTGAAK